MVALNGQQVGSTGFGLMGNCSNAGKIDYFAENCGDAEWYPHFDDGLTWRPTPTPVEKAIETMKAALNSGNNFWNGGVFYGPPENNSLHLLNAYFTKYPEDADKVVISIKGGVNTENFTPDGSKEGVKRSVEECLKVLDGKKKLDIFECARKDPKVPIEETVSYIAEYVKEGKVGGIGISEVGPESIRRAAKAHTIAAVEVEFSLFTTDIKSNDVAKTCHELKIPIVAYSPLGWGFLTGAIKSPDDLPVQIKHLPRFQPEVFHKNFELVSELQKIAEQKSCTPAQLAISWVKSQGTMPGMPAIIPIPGATTVARVEENSKDVSLTEAELKEIDTILSTIPVTGARYGGDHEALLWG